MFIKNGINYSKRHDLEHPIVCNIWIQIKTNKNKIITFMGGYRQWNLPKKLINIINNPSQQIIINQIISDSLPNAHLYKALFSSRVNRCKIILQQWTQAL